jgi:hypothetical protein
MKIPPSSLGLLGVSIIFLFLLISRVDRKLSLVGQFPDAMKLNYEKYGILGIVGVIIIAIIIIEFWVFWINQFYTSSRVLSKR